MYSLKKSLPSLAIAAGLYFGVATSPMQAEDYDRCQRRIIHAEHRLHEAVEKHGANSERARHERHELRSVRERCWREQHRWWDEREHRWHTERDWEDHDRD
jgi:hypothetical protein